MEVTIHEAKTFLPRLIVAVERVQEVVIAWRGKPVVRWIAEKPVWAKRALGRLERSMSVDPGSAVSSYIIIWNRSTG